MPDISQEWKRKVELVLEFYVRFDCIWTDPKDCDTSFFIRGVILPEIAGFFSATRGVIGGIKVEDNRFAPEICQPARNVLIID
jgi:hypothetical protein